jgi:hypothetical protein
MMILSSLMIITNAHEPVTPNWRLERAHSTKFVRRAKSEALDRYDIMRENYNQVKI